MCLGQSLSFSVHLEYVRVFDISIMEEKSSNMIYGFGSWTDGAFVKTGRKSSLRDGKCLCRDGKRTTA